MWSLYTVYHFWMRIFSGRVPVFVSYVDTSQSANPWCCYIAGKGRSVAAASSITEGRTRLRRHELLQVTDGVVLVALDANLFACAW